MAYLATLKHEFKIMAMTETYFKDMTIDTFSVNGYQHIYDYRNARTGGGVPLFIKNGIEYVKSDDLSVFNNDIESLFIEVTNMKSSSGRAIVVGVICRPQDQDINEFSITMSTILDKLKSEKKSTYLSSDYNINLLNTDKHVPTAEFLDTMFSYFMYPFINRPTRCIKQSATLIDNIYSNIFEHGILTGIFYTDITDHFPI